MFLVIRETDQLVVIFFLYFKAFANTGAVKLEHLNISSGEIS